MTNNLSPLRKLRPAALLSLVALLCAAGFYLVRPAGATGTPVSLTAINTTYTQNFDTLASSSVSIAFKKKIFCAGGVSAQTPAPPANCTMPGFLAGHSRI